MFKSHKTLTLIFFIILLLPACQQIPNSDSKTTLFKMGQQDTGTLTDTILSSNKVAVPTTTSNVAIEGLQSAEKDSSLSDNSGYMQRGIRKSEEKPMSKEIPTKANTPTIKLSKTSYNENEKIEANYSNMSGNTKDWVGVFKANDADKNYLQYDYTNGNKSGKASFNGLPAGNYEIRVYFDDSYKVEGKASFKVQGNSPTPIKVATPVTAPSTSTKPVTVSSTSTNPKIYSSSEYDSIKPITINFASDRMWRDMDADGDFDVIMYTDGKIRENALEHAAKELEDGSFGRIDITYIRGTRAQADDDNYGGFMTTESLSYWGSSGYGPNARLRMTTQWAYTDGNFLHEMMHCVGVTLDEKGNNGDSIMDYNYRKSGLSTYDKGLLKHMYRNAKTGINNRPTIVDKRWHN